MLKLILNYDKKGERKKLYYYIKSITNSWNIISIFMKSLSQKAVANTSIICDGSNRNVRISD